MSSYKHFTLEERKKLEEGLKKGKSQRAIARELGRSASSISREVARNISKTAKRYHHWHAQSLTIERRRKASKCRRCFQPETPQWDYIIEKLKVYWSPEAICGRWKLEHPKEKAIHFSTIYRYLKRKEFPGVSRKSHLRTEI